jgi:phosphoenolpyruvate carboxykinase (GTP)
VAPNTSKLSNPNAMHACDRETIFTNVAMTEDKDVWWEGMGMDAPGKLIDWKGKEWEESTATAPAAHPNSRFTARAKNCPAIAPEWEDPNGVPISAFLFGGRRPSTIPLVYQAFDWIHGVFIASCIGSEITAAALDLKVGLVRRDPMAMLPFCGYHMGDYFKHWVKLGAKADPNKLPKIFSVNWFRKTKEGKWLWPGYGENSRVLKWVFERCDNSGSAVKTPIGYMPAPEAINTKGLDVSADDMRQLLSVDDEGWGIELDMIKEHYDIFGDKLPKELSDQLTALEKRFKNA